MEARGGHLRNPHYVHRQSPAWFPVLIAGLLGIGAVVWLTVGWHGSLWGVFGGAAVFGARFWGLTVEVTAEAVTLAFGAGLIRRTIPRARIKAVRQVRNAWYWGFGIRVTPHGWMWNIAGLDAVEIEYADGARFRIGTDDPAGLLAALGAGSKSG
jgi:hypothetical protein